MSTNANIDRAVLLFQQSRFDLAEQELRQALMANPNEPQAHALLSLCLVRREEFADATAEAQAAIGLAPDWAYPQYCLSRVMLARNRLAEAEAAAREAVQLSPEDADYWGQLGHVHMSQRRWQDALSAAEQGLSHDAEDAQCANLRTLALAQMGRSGAAQDAVDETLAKHPDNASSHSAKGWALLHANKPREALEHFREALRIDPTQEFARQGMIEALKAHNLIYRLMLGYFLWMNRLDRRVQWALILGGYFGQKTLMRLADENPAMGPWVWPIICVYIAFVLLTWFAVPMFNLLLRLNKFGRHALSRDQRMGANCFAVCLAIFCGGMATSLFLAEPWSIVSIMVGLAGAGCALPIVTIFQCDAGWPRKMMTLYAAAMVLVALGVFMLPLIGLRGNTTTLVGAFVWGFILTPWIANYLMMQTVRR